MSRSKRIADFLGMPHGTAMAKLRKNILFHQLKKHNENVCFRCQKQIITADELSVDHIEPWESLSVELFWSLENIAFSHRKCNRPHRNKGGGSKKRLFPPEGMAWCAEHKAFLPKEKFDKGGRWDGVKDYCKECPSSRREQGKGR